jgi:hypothetical protein
MIPQKKAHKKIVEKSGKRLYEDGMKRKKLMEQRRRKYDEDFDDFKETMSKNSPKFNQEKQKELEKEREERWENFKQNKISFKKKPKGTKERYHFQSDTEFPGNNKSEESEEEENLIDFETENINKLMTNSKKKVDAFEVTERLYTKSKSPNKRFSLSQAQVKTNQQKSLIKPRKITFGSIEENVEKIIKMDNYEVNEDIIQPSPQPYTPDTTLLKQKDCQNITNKSINKLNNKKEEIELSQHNKHIPDTMAYELVEKLLSNKF